MGKVSSADKMSIQMLRKQDYGATGPRLLRRGMDADCLHFKSGEISTFQGVIMV